MVALFALGSDSEPIIVLEPPVVITSPAVTPIPILLFPVVTAFKAAYPIAVLFPPVAILRVLVPNAELPLAVLASLLIEAEPKAQL